MPKKPFFSIVIPTLNEEKYLPHLLSDLSKQTFPKELFEVIHVDGDSDDQTITEAKKFTKKISIKSKLVKKRNVAYQRNQGIKLAKGKWLLFMDADNRLAPYFLDGLSYRIAKKPKTDLFTTWATINKSESFNQPIEKMLNYWLELGNLIGKEWAFGALIGVKKEIITPETYFDEKQKVAEDGYFIKNLVEQSYIFNIFKDPCYTYSLRRFNSEGKIKALTKGALVSFNYIQGKNFIENDFGYKMEGGTAYDVTSSQDIPSLYPSNLQKAITGATKTQIREIRDLFKRFFISEF